jgi:hypothetical protein
VNFVNYGHDSISVGFFLLFCRFYPCSDLNMRYICNRPKMTLVTAREISPMEVHGPEINWWFLASEPAIEQSSV